MQDQLPAGTLLNRGRYVIESLYRSGGQCFVYVGRDLTNDRRVIIKQPKEDWAQEALRQEGELLASLDHPSLPRVVDRFEERGSTFLVTTYIPGIDLEELLRRRGGPINVDEVVSWAEQLLDILEYLQGQEPHVVHRDINPRNIRLAPDGHLFLLDFGVAKKSGKRTLLVGGTPHYAPPEQFRDEGTDNRSDIYSFAATLYYLLTATEPPDSLSRSIAVGKGLPDLLFPASALNGDVPLYLCRLLTEAMSLERERRPSSAVIFRHRLRSKSLATEEGEIETVTSPRRGDDPEMTAVRSREAGRSGDSAADAATSEQTPPDSATQMARRLLDGIRDGDAIAPDVIQIVIELMDARPQARSAIMRRYRSVLASHKRNGPPLVFNFIESLARNSTPARSVSSQLREALGKMLAKISPEESTSSGQESGRSHPPIADLIIPDGVRRAESHRRWLRWLLIWVARGVLVAFGIKLILLLIAGRFTFIESLPLANLALVAYSAIMLVIIRWVSQLDEDQIMAYNSLCSVAAFLYGAVLVDVFVHDLTALII